MRVYRGLSFVLHTTYMRILVGFLLICLGWWPVLALEVARADTMTAAPVASGTIMPHLPPKPVVPMPVPVPVPVGASPLPPPRAAALAMDPGTQCRVAGIEAGRTAGIPDHLMSAIARVESGRRGANGQVNPWPWSINVEGTDHIYDTREQAIAAVRGFRSAGVRSIDVGCMQINLLHHPDAFASLEQAFDPVVNTTYAAHFLKDLFEQTGSWPKATAGYHSLTQALGDPYQRKVASVMAEEAGSDAIAGGNGAHLAMGQSALGQSALGIFGMAPPIPARMLGNHSDNVHIILSTNATAGRDLAAYRMMPVRVAGRP